MVVEPSNLYPARPRHGPKDFAWILRALSGVLNANSKPSRPRSGAGSDRSGGEGLAPSTKQPETTLKQNAVWETRYKRELDRCRGPPSGFLVSSSRTALESMKLSKAECFDFAWKTIECYI